MPVIETVATHTKEAMLTISGYECTYSCNMVSKQYRVEFIIFTINIKLLHSSQSIAGVRMVLL